MEKILNQILNEIVEIKQGQAKLEQGQAKLEQGQAKLEQGQAKLEQGQAKLEQNLAKVVNQTANLIEFRTETLAKLDQLTEKQNSICSDIEFLAGELGKQKLDIERLKKKIV